MRGSMFVGAALLCGCGSAFTSASSGDAGGVDALDDGGGGGADAPHVEASADVGPDGWGDTLTPDAADVVQDASHLEAAPEVDAGPCTPLAFPLAPPAGCSVVGQPITAPGTIWLLQSQATPPTCMDYALSEAGTACEQCAQTFTCACLDPDASLIGVTCVGGATPYLSQN